MGPISHTHTKRTPRELCNCRCKHTSTDNQQCWHLKHSSLKHTLHAPNYIPFPRLSSSHYHFQLPSSLQTSTYEACKQLNQFNPIRSVLDKPSPCDVFVHDPSYLPYMLHPFCLALLIHYMFHPFVPGPS